ncbi:hypothetical protein [Planctomonas deserti]|uniref:hypothetical protein n=1 Tax=Planctomonas deserti TaxID=2144185 RepID=UPI000D3795A0|nr:hypothetical protein [Planctomonas deserti]
MPASPASRATAVRTALTGLLLASALGLTGCAGAGAAASPPESSMDAGMDHSDMSDGDMSGGDMAHDMSDGDAAHGDAAAAGTQGEPSEAAAMICSPEIRDAIASVLALPAPVEGDDSYMHGHYACDYDLDGGPLELSVHEAADANEAQAYADSVRSDYGTAEDIEGLANLGFPAYRTAEGAVVFVKDSMVLVVDAREITVPEAGDAPTRTDAAYQIATNVLACWKAHHSE